MIIIKTKLGYYKESISGSASEEEIRAVVWSLKPFKAPGPDGLHAGFFFLEILAHGGKFSD